MHKYFLIFLKNKLVATMDLKLIYLILGGEKKMIFFFFLHYLS